MHAAQTFRHRSTISPEAATRIAGWSPFALVTIPETGKISPSKEIWRVP